MNDSKIRRRRRKWIRRAIIAMSVFLVVAVVGLISFPACTRAPATARPRVVRFENAAVATPTGELVVMSLNLAHGRKLDKIQGHQSRAKIEDNLRDIASLLRREQPHVVALQEADSNSWWNGRFNHAAFIAAEADYPYAMVGNHVSGLGLHYGSGFITRVKPADATVHTFQRKKAYFSKGFTVATVELGAGGKVDVVAVHLDFASHAVRSSEVVEMTEILRPRLARRPLIVVGDFNSQWLAAESPVRDFATALGLRTWEPESKTIVTFPDFGSRLDYILISPELEFVDHRVLTDTVSDHRAVIARIRRRQDDSGTSKSKGAEGKE